MTKKPKEPKRKKVVEFCPYCELGVSPLTIAHVKACYRIQTFRLLKRIVELLENV